MEFRDGELTLMQKMYLKVNSPITIREMSDILGYSQYGKAFWKNPLIRKLEILGVIIPSNSGKPIYYDIDKKKLKSLFADIERIVNWIKIFETTTIWGKPKYK